MEKHFTKCSSNGFVFHFGELVKLPIYNVNAIGSSPVNVILKSGERGKGPGVETRVEPLGGLVKLQLKAFTSQATHVQC